MAGFVSTNISGLVRQIAAKNPNHLFPIFETVVNSIHSIQELDRKDRHIEMKWKA